MWILFDFDVGRAWRGLLCLPSVHAAATEAPCAEPSVPDTGRDPDRDGVCALR